MKIKVQLTLSHLLALAVALSFCGCSKQEGASNETRQGAAPASQNKAIVSAERTSFQEVTSQLDPGGNFYLYLGTEQWLEGLSAKIAGLRALADSIPNVGDDDRQNIQKVIDIVTNLVKDSGLQEISGFGMSSIAREKGFYHTRTVLHHYKGKDSGFLWPLFGQKAHALEGLNLLPANTAFATFSDLDVARFWAMVKAEVAKSGFPQADELLKQLPEKFEQMSGLKWDTVLASLGGEFGFVLTLDDTHQLSLPLPGANGPLEIPEPALMLVAKVKDDTVFNRIQEALNMMGQNVVSNDAKGVKMRTVPVPLPLPIQLRPTVATGGGYLFIANSDSVIKEALAVKAGEKPGLKTTDEFKHLSADVPLEGNQFSFLSQRLSLALVRVQRQAFDMAANQAPGQTEWLKSLVTTNQAAFAFTVSANSDEGWSTVGNGNQHPAKLLAAGAIVPAVLAGVAVPAFVKAREAAHKNAE